MSEQDGTPHPGRILLQRAMEPLGISRNQLARDLDVPVGRISDITNGKRGITADTALRLGRYFSTGPEIWLRMQAEYDLSVARASTWSAIVDRVRVLAEAEDDGSDDAYSPSEPPLASVPRVEAAEPTAAESLTPPQVETPEPADPAQYSEPESPAFASPASSEETGEPPALSAPPPPPPVFASPTSPARPLETAEPTVMTHPAPTGMQEPVTSRPPPPAGEDEGPMALRPVPPSVDSARSEERTESTQPSANDAPAGNDDIRPEPVLELREAWVREEVPRDDDIGIPPVPGNRIENS